MLIVAITLVGRIILSVHAHSGDHVRLQRNGFTVHTNQEERLLTYSMTTYILTNHEVLQLAYIGKSVHAEKKVPAQCINATPCNNAI
ncbi:hypothetical protein F4779DRAFT_596868 [Xylariaceae sp. FL0662B]|nr:hypothetical protein F4779DRAFT_596868 [Xylariaceae sp. FL0662B]